MSLKHGAIQKLGCSFLFAFYSNYIAVSVAVCSGVVIGGPTGRSPRAALVKGAAN